MTTIPAFMYPKTARMLLSMSRQNRVRVQLQRELRQQGWSDSACAELAEIHIKLENGNGTAQVPDAR